MIESKIRTKASPELVWQAWRKAHGMSVDFVPGKEGKVKGNRYRILAVNEGESFSIAWKSFMTRLIFTQEVLPDGRGSQIRYCAEIRGPFAWLLRRLMKNQIQRNLVLVLQSLAKELDTI